MKMPNMYNLLSLVIIIFPFYFCGFTPNVLAFSKMTRSKDSLVILKIPQYIRGKMSSKVKREYDNY